MDADFECLRPIDELIGGAECFAAWEQQGRWIANGFMGAAPKHPFIQTLIRAIPVSVRRHRGARPTRISGPQFFTRQWRASRYRDEILVLDQSLVYPYGYADVAEVNPQDRFPGVYAIHHWHNRRRQRGLLPEAA